MDATAKFPHGFLMGNLQIMGDFDECLSSNASPGIEPQYCTASIELNAHKMHPSQSKLYNIFKIITYDRLHREKINISEGNIPLHKSAVLEWGVCMPASCSPSDLESILNGAMQHIMPDSLIRLNVSSNECYTNMPNSQLTTRDRVIVFAMLFIVLLVVMGTINDRSDPNNNEPEETSSLSKVLSAFSLKRNWNDLTDFSTPRVGQIECLDGMRSISSLWIVIGHQGLLASANAYSDKITIFNTHKYSAMMVMWNFFLSVDTFLVIAGLVRCYTLIASLERRTVNHWKNVLMRYFRLTPALLTVIGFHMAIVNRLASGPFWYRRVTANKIACDLHWWKTILYINNYTTNDGYMCILQSWYTSMDMQFFLVSPLIIVPLWKKPRVGVIILSITAAIVLIVQWATIVTYNLPGVLTSFQTDLSATVEHMYRYYFPSHTRAMPYLIGIVMGYILYYYRTVTLTKAQQVVGWFLTLLGCTWTFIEARDIMSTDRHSDIIENAIYGTLHKSVWAMAMAWIIFTCYHGYGGIVNRVLCCNFFRFFSKISYSVFLSHYIFISICSGYMRVPKHGDAPSIIKDLFTETVWSLIPSILLYLFVEAPMSTISQMYFKKSKHTAKKVQ